MRQLPMSLSAIRAMILRTPRSRPAPWRTRRRQIGPRWIVPFAFMEWLWEWPAFALSNWKFLEVLEYLSTFSVLVAVIFYFSEAGDRVKARHYQAWQVINTAQGKGGSGGRIEALEELNEDRVPLVGVDVSSAFLQGLRLEHANLLRCDLSTTDLRGSDLAGSDLTQGNLNGANFRKARLDRARLVEADLRNADLNGASLADSDLSGATLDQADLRNADLRAVKWRELRSVTGTNISGVRNAPAGFVEWATRNGAVMEAGAGQ